MGRRMLSVSLPRGFVLDRDRSRLEAQVRRARGDQWTLSTVDETGGKAHFVAAGPVSEDGRKGVRLPSGVRPSDGPAQAVILSEAFEARYPGEGWVMTEFDPYLRQAVMSRLDPEEQRAREALATALGVRPWEVQVHRADQGFDVRLPASYTASRHDQRIHEAVTGVIGAPGWWTRVDAASLTMEVRPGRLPTFPASVPYPFDSATRSAGTWELPLGVGLGEPGEPSRPVVLDLDATPGVLVTGTSGSGKSVLVNGLIASALARGWELALVDVPHKAVDFLWCKDLCRPGGWGCDSKEQALTVLRLVYEEGQRRARLLHHHGVQKIQDLPDQERPRPLLAVVDEVTGLFALEPVPKGIPKDHPLVVEATEKNLVTQTLSATVSKIAAEMRFTGVRILLSTQMAQANTGVSVPLKMNLANRVLLGANPNDATRGHALLDPRSVPRVPEWVRADQQASQGVGVTELDGQAPGVLKGFWAGVPELRAYLDGLGVPVCHAPEPSVGDVARMVPSLDDDGASQAPREREEPPGDPGGDPGEPRGAARAAHDLAASAAHRSRQQDPS